MSKKKSKYEIAAVEDLKRKIRNSRNKGDFHEVAKLHNTLGHQYRLLGKFEDALEQHQEEIQICQKYDKKDKLGLAVGYRNMGEVLIEMKEGRKALKYIELYLQIAKALGNYVEQQRALITLGRVYLSMTEDETEEETHADTTSKYLSKAYKCFKEAHLLLKEEEAEFKKQIGDVKELMLMKCSTYQNLGLVLESMGKPSDAALWLIKAVDLGVAYKFNENLAPCYTTLCSIYLKTGKPKEALNAAKNGTKFSKALGDSRMEVESLLNEARALFRMDEVERVKKLLKRLRQKLLKKDKSELRDYLEDLDPLLIASVKICRALDELLAEVDVTRKMKLHEILGDNYSSPAVGNYKEAISHYKKSCELAEKLGFKGKKLGKLYFSLAETYKDVCEYKDAYEYYMKEMNLYNDDKNAVEEFRTQTNIAMILEKMEKPRGEIIDAYKTAIAFAKTTSSFSKQVVAITNFGIFLNGIGMNEEGEKQLKLAEKIKKEHNIRDDEDDDEADSQELLNMDEEVDLDNLSEEEYSDDEADDDKSKKSRKRYTFQRRNEAGETPLHLAAKKGDLRQVMRLIRDGHPVKVKDFAGWSPLHEAANFGHHQVVKELLKHGAEVDEFGGKDVKDKITALHDAAGNCHCEVMKVLLEYGANVLAKDSQGRYPIDHLISWHESATDPSEIQVQAYREIKEILKERMAQAGKFYGRDDERKIRRRATVRNRSPEMALQVKKGQDFDCPIPVTITTDDFDPDDEGEGTKLYIKAIKQVRRKENDTGRSKARPREISPGPQGALIPCELDVHNDNNWLLPDDTITTKQNEVVKLSSTCCAKRKRESFEDLRRGNGDRNRRRKTSESRRWSSRESSPSPANELEAMDVEIDLIDDVLELESTNRSKHTSRNSRILDEDDDDDLDLRLNVDDEFQNELQLSPDYNAEDDILLPSQRPLSCSSSTVEFGVTRDVPVVERDESDEERISPVFASRSRRKSPRKKAASTSSMINLSSDEEDDVRPVHQQKRQSLSNVADIFRRSRVISEDKRAGNNPRLPIQIKSKSDRTRISNEAINQRDVSPEVGISRFRRTSSTTSLDSRTKNEIWRLKIKVDSDILLVPLDENQQRLTIHWLASECTERYSRLHGLRPLLTLQTKDGATLCGSDPINLVLGETERELKAVVGGYDQPPLLERYSSACSEAGIDENPDMKSCLNSCQSSNVLEATDIILRGSAAAVLMKALQRQNSLKILILSGCSLFDNGISELCKILSTLSGLAELDLSQNGITSYGFTSIADVFEKECQPSDSMRTVTDSAPFGLQILKLNHNPLGCLITKPLASLLTRLVSLKCLEMVDCNITEKLFLSAELTNAFSNSRLEDVNFSYNPLKSIGIEKLFNSLPARKLKSLNCSSCALNSGDTSAEVIARSICRILSQNEDCCNLKSLHLNDSGLTDKAMDSILENFHRLVRLESLELALNDELTSHSLIKILDTSVESDLPLTKLDLGSIPKLWDTPTVNDEMILDAIEKKMNSSKKLVFLKLPSSPVDLSKTCSQRERDYSQLETKMISLMEDYSGNMEFHHEKSGSIIIYRFED